VTYVPERVHREIYKRCNVEKGDVLYIKDGVTTGIATVNTLDEEFSLLSSVALLKPRRHILDSLFLKYYLNSPEGLRNMTGQMTGTAIKRLILQKIKSRGCSRRAPPRTAADRGGDREAIHSAGGGGGRIAAGAGQPQTLRRRRPQSRLRREASADRGTINPKERKGQTGFPLYVLCVLCG